MKGKPCPFNYSRGSCFHSALRVMMSIFVISILLMQPGSYPAQAADYSTVRVLLTSLNLQDRIHIGVYGSYTLDQNISFQRGSELLIVARGSGLMVYYGGMSYWAEDSLRLLRHQGKEQKENGLRLQQGLNIYPGDLTITAENGRLRAILSVPVEEYLLGVVPYEMADDFPPEALKAQAVTARTYALKNLDAASDYDVEDSTNDQVYRGTDSGKVNAIAAVAATSGIVNTFGGSLAHSFYTASNGGLTESAFNAWGRERIPYLTIQEDKYDLENPKSEVRTSYVPKTIAENDSFAESPLYMVLLNGVASQIGPLGYDTNPEYIRITCIRGITPHKGMYGEEQGVMSLARFHLSVNGRKPIQVEKDTEISLEQEAGFLVTDPLNQGNPVWSEMNPLSVEVLVDYPIFPDLEQMLSLSINQSQNELFQVREEEDRFTLRFTRYGHGVGMSQRGAEWMAGEYKLDYQAILAFYYPGTELKKVNTQAAALLPAEVDFLTTPGPIPTPTPRPTLMPQSVQTGIGNRLVTVTGVAANSTLNLRAEPSLSSEVLVRLMFGQELVVVSELPDGWLLVKTDVIQGYVMKDFVSEKQTN
jgi:peptidoglycan hydrolase-like amidase